MFKRKLRLEILLLFLFLIAASSAIIIIFTYSKSTKNIEEISRGTIDRVTDLIQERTNCLLNDLGRLPELGEGGYLRNRGISENNQELIAYFLDVAKYYPNVYAYYVGEPNGNALIVFNLTQSRWPHNFTNPNLSLPKGTRFVILLVDGVQKREFWSYYDDDLRLIQKEEPTYRGYDPRKRPWYIGAMEARKLHWTDVFVYDPTVEEGIAVALPIYDKNGELIAVIGTDLSLRRFTQFLQTQPIGRGKTYILDERGNLIVPESIEPDEKMTVGLAYERYEKQRKNYFSFNDQGQQYLAGVHPFPIAGKNWLIVFIDTLGDFFSEMIHAQQEVILISLAVLILAAILVVYFSNHISAPIVALAHEIERISRLDLGSDVRVKSGVQEINMIDSSIASMRAALRSFSRYVPKEIAFELMQRGHEIVLGGEKQKATTFFADICGFTPYAESLPIETLNELLAEYFDGMSKIILAHQGTIDKYIGDSIMVLWGVPKELPNGATLACEAALKCLAWVKDLNAKRRAKKMPEFPIRIGIETGIVYAGNFGTTERMNYTAIGDSVNIAFRLEQINKFFRTEILIGEDTVRHLPKDLFLLRPLDIVEIKGKSKRLQIYELRGLKEKAGSDEIEFCRLYAEGLLTFYRGDYTEARAVFEKLYRQHPEDYPTQYFLERLKKV